MALDIKRGDVLYCRLKSNGNIQGGVRPVVVVQNDIGNEYSPTTIIVPFTTKLKNATQPTHLLLNLPHGSNCVITNMLLAEQLTTINKRQLQSKVTHLSTEIMDQVDKKIIISLSL